MIFVKFEPFAGVNTSGECGFTVVMMISEEKFIAYFCRNSDILPLVRCLLNVREFFVWNSSQFFNLNGLFRDDWIVACAIARFPYCHWQSLGFDHDTPLFPYSFEAGIGKKQFFWVICVSKCKILSFGFLLEKI